jgi:hypothetical protein
MDQGELVKKSVEEIGIIMRKQTAGIFGVFFKELARNPTEECREVARAIWVLRFQFLLHVDDREMGADGALVKLGLAKVSEVSVPGEETARMTIEYL